VRHSYVLQVRDRWGTVMYCRLEISETVTYCRFDVGEAQLCTVG
jgi:hypothetical protein